MSRSQVTTKPGEGERRAASGYRAQYLVGAQIVLEALQSGDLAWVRIADPDAGRVDDLQVAKTARIDAYQVKWSQYPGAITLNDLVKDTEEQPSLFAQLVDGWRGLRGLYSHYRIIVHFVTNEYPSSSTSASMPPTSCPPVPYHFAAFIDQSWRPGQESGKIDISGVWGGVWEALRNAGALSMDELPDFVRDCSLDFRISQPIQSADLLSVADFLFATAAASERVIELSRESLLQRLGWTNRYVYRNKHEFPSPAFLYQPIGRTVAALEDALSTLPGGYLGVFGSPGSGKSTLLTQTLRSFPLRLVRYYAYVPEAQDPSALRGESTNFLHDVTLQMEIAGFGRGPRPDPTNRAALIELFHSQLQELGRDHTETQIKTAILIDGLDHIAREQHPERSLFQDLPLPQALPNGVYIVVGSQTAELPDLPPRVRGAFEQEGRRVAMDRLSPGDVYAIAQEAVPVLNGDDQQKVFQLSDGHPLALIYLLKQLQQTEDLSARAQLFENAIPYEGDIEEQYQGHWHNLERDEHFVHTLGLLARVRGPIPMRWVAEWADTGILRKLQRLFLVYFEQEGEERWTFFHNSFRLFLIDRTSEPLPGRSREDQNRAYHRELAERYANSSEPWRWEALYHYYSANEVATVVRLATQEWFREQVNALRPLDAIQTDVRLAIQNAGACEDIVALARLTLVGASVEQRAWTLEKHLLPDLLLKVGEIARAVEHLRDGSRLRVEAEQALRLSTRLADAGLEREGHRLFELAEPLELLSGRAITDNRAQSQDLWGLLGEWVQSAVVFRGIQDVLQTIRRIRLDPSPWQKDTSIEEASQSLQVWLLFKGALACCERGDWVRWQVLFDSFDETSESLERFFTLLRSAERAQQAGEAARAGNLFESLLTTYGQSDIQAATTNRQWIEACLSVAELALQPAGKAEVASEWGKRLPLVPLYDRNAASAKEPSLHELQFRQAHLFYRLGESRSPEALRDEAEKHTQFAVYMDEEEKSAWRHTALAIFQVAQLSAWGQCGTRLGPTIFLQEVRWILDLFGLGWSQRPPRSRFAIAGGRTEVLRYMMVAGSEHGSQVIHALEQELESRWANREEERAWGTALQRELVTALMSAGGDLIWAERRLARIERVMLEGLEPHERVEACEAQTEAWLALGKREAALRTIRQMVHAARGIPSDGDYQLAAWVSWLGRMNEAESEHIEERTRLMLRRIAAVEGTASGVVDAAEKLLGVVFRWSPQRSVTLLKGLLERDIVGYQAGITAILAAALTAEEVPIFEVFHAVVNLVIPLVLDSDSDLLKMLVTQVFVQAAKQTALDMTWYLEECIRTSALPKHRSSWYRGIADGLQAVGVLPGEVGLGDSEIEDQSQFQSSSSLDYNLYLQTGECLTPQQVLARASTVGDLRGLLVIEDRERTRYFQWAPVVEHIASTLVSEDIKEIEDIATSRLPVEQFDQILKALSERALALGERDLAWQLAERALKATTPSGWAPYYDSGRKHAVLKQLITISPDRARNMAIHLYGHDLGGRLEYPGQIALCLEEILSLLIERLPVLEVWPDIDRYLDELFSSVLVEPQPALEKSIAEIPNTLPDSPGHAVAALMVLHLDHPSYVVAQGAVRACAALLLAGSETITVALRDALSDTDEAVERALMAMDAASLRSTASVRLFTEELERLRSSPNFCIRQVASRISARIQDQTPTVPMVKREEPGIFSLHLPESAFHHTERTLHGEEGPVLIEDPARELRPLDIELRAVAEAVDVPEDNLFYRAVQHFRTLRTRRTWLTEQDVLAPNRISAFLDQVGLRLSHNKPHIAPARQALAYVLAELYDGAYLHPRELQWLARQLTRHDPHFILESAVQRPSYVDPMGGISYEYSLVRLPDGWVNTAKDSLGLLLSRTPDGRVIMGERTQLRLLDDNWPEETRISVVRAEGASRFWDGLDVQAGHPPFHRLHGIQADDYLHIQAPANHLVVCNDPHYHETPGSRWLALNPAVGEALGWHPVPGYWFRWSNQAGVPVAESLWWNDGPMEQYYVHLHVEVGDGWLVLVTESGFEEIRRWATQLNRGGIVRRSLGQHGLLGRSYAERILELE